MKETPPYMVIQTDAKVSLLKHDPYISRSICHDLYRETFTDTRTQATYRFSGIQDLPKFVAHIFHFSTRPVVATHKAESWRMAMCNGKLSFRQKVLLSNTHTS